MKHKDAHVVAHHIDHVGDNRHHHGDARLAHTAEKRGTCIVDRQRRIRERRYAQVGETGCHDVWLDTAKHQPQQLPREQQHRRAHTHRKDHREHEKLARRLTREVAVARTHVLRHNHGTASRQSREQEDEHGVELVDQRHASHGGLTRLADEERVGQTHEHDEQLLEEQGHDHARKVAIRERLDSHGTPPDTRSLSTTSMESPWP